MQTLLCNRNYVLACTAQKAHCTGFTKHNIKVTSETWQPVSDQMGGILSDMRSALGLRKSWPVQSLQRLSTSMQ